MIQKFYGVTHLWILWLIQAQGQSPSGLQRAQRRGRIKDPDLNLSQEGTEVVSGSVVRGKSREESNKYGQQRTVCVEGQAARARISV